MGNLFAASEIVEIGIQIEKNGCEFYSELAAKSKSLNSKEIFEYLANEEQKHIKVFKSILEKTQQYEPTQSFADDYLAYMRALAAEHIFTQEGKGKIAAQKATSDIEAVNMGIGFEKESIVFYEGMKKVVPANEHSIIDELILQEQHHLIQLWELKERLDK